MTDVIFYHAADIYFWISRIPDFILPEYASKFLTE
jgi:hypothetical protein